MTREEMEELKGLAASMGLYDDKNPCKRAVILGKAIKASEQEPCEDAISRQAAIVQLSHNKTGDDDCDVIIQKDIETIKALPSVNPQPKTGYWIKVKSGDKDFPESIVCSRCGNENSHLDFNENAEPIGKVFVTSKFCPNCGAKMSESEG